MNTKQQIAVMQAYLDGKTIQYRVSADCWVDIVDREPAWNWGGNEYRIKPEPVLPNTWEEFCETHPIQKGEAYVSMESNSMVWEGSNERRSSDRDRIFLPNERLAEAMIALCQLIQLRDCYNNGWQPDWKEDSLKYVIDVYSNDTFKDEHVYNNIILAFATAGLRDKFEENFHDLIEIAKPLL